MKTLLTILILAMAGAAFAEQKQVTAEFDFAAPPPDNIVQPVKLNFYQNNELVYQEVDVLLRSVTFPTIFTSLDVIGSRAEKSFTMDVEDNQGRKSQLSNSAVGGFDISDLPSLSAPGLNAVVIGP